MFFCLLIICLIGSTFDLLKRFSLLQFILPDGKVSTFNLVSSSGNQQNQFVNLTYRYPRRQDCANSKRR